MRILLALLIPAAAFAQNYERDCDRGGSLQACALFGAELARKYQKSLDPTVGDRAFSYFERACLGGYPSGCSWMSALWQTRTSEAERYLQRSCDFGWADSCLQLGAWRPAEKQRLTERACAMAAKLDERASWMHWSGAVMACHTLASGTRDKVLAAKLTLVAALASLEKNEALYFETDSSEEQQASNVDDSYAREASRSRSSVDWVGAAQQLATGLQGVAANYNRNVANANQIVRQYEENRAARNQRIAASNRPPPQAPPTSFRVAQNTQQPPNPYAQSSAQQQQTAQQPQQAQPQKQQQLAACMAQPITPMRMSQTNPFLTYAKGYESLRDHDLRICEAEKNYQACMGSNSVLWPDPNAQRDNDDFYARAQKAGVYFPYSGEYRVTRQYCLNGPATCRAYLNAHVRALYRAYEAVQKIWDKEYALADKEAERRRDEDCKRRFP
jgi:hypothetical protein